MFSREREGGRDRGRERERGGGEREREKKERVFFFTEKKNGNEKKTRRSSPSAALPIRAPPSQSTRPSSAPGPMSSCGRGAGGPTRSGCRCTTSWRSTGEERSFVRFFLNFLWVFFLEIKKKRRRKKKQKNSNFPKTQNKKNSGGGPRSSARSNTPPSSRGRSRSGCSGRLTSP